MGRQQPGFGHQGILGLGAKRMLHHLAQGEIQHHHPQEKHHHEGKKQLGEDPARHEASLFHNPESFERLQNRFRRLTYALPPHPGESRNGSPRHGRS